MREKHLGDFYAVKVKSLNPQDFPDEKFDYYSIPAFDKGSPLVTLGKEIGSSKKVIEEGDVVLSRIVPHIRRCWVVEKGEGLRKIGSSEWIVFRTTEVDSKFLKYYLTSDKFNNKFLKTIKGVGGSLMRADPKQVARFKIPLPPLNQQKKIAEILDTADAYRQKTKALQEKYDQLANSIFLDLFGDPIHNHKGYDTKSLEELTYQITDGTHHTPKYTDSGVPFFRVTDITKSNDSKKFISQEEHEQLIKRCNPEKGDILYTKNGTIGVSCIIEWDFEFSIFVSLCLMKPKTDMVNTKYLNHFLNTPFALRQATKHSKLATIKNLHLNEIKKMKVIVPPMTEQLKFEKILNEISKQVKISVQSQNKADELFNSLLQRAFKGELTN